MFQYLFILISVLIIGTNISEGYQIRPLKSSDENLQSWLWPSGITKFENLNNYLSQYKDVLEQISSQGYFTDPLWWWPYLEQKYPSLSISPGNNGPLLNSLHSVLEKIPTGYLVPENLSGKSRLNENSQLFGDLEANDIKSSKLSEVSTTSKRTTST